MYRYTVHPVSVSVLDAFGRISKPVAKYRGIEDTDTERHNEAAVDAILQLCWMGMVMDGGWWKRVLENYNRSLSDSPRKNIQGFLEVLTSFYGKLPRCFITSRKRRCSGMMFILHAMVGSMVQEDLNERCFLFKEANSSLELPQTKCF